MCHSNKKIRTFKSNSLNINITEEPESAEIIEIQLFGEDHTLGNLLATFYKNVNMLEKQDMSCRIHLKIKLL